MELKIGVGFGIALAIATALIQLAIQLWEGGQHLPAAVLFVVGGLLFILASYTGFAALEKSLLGKLKK